MSGVLSSISAATSGALPSAVLGLLQTASWRGVVFDMLDSTDTVSRRWAKFLFPGRDDSEHEDLGAADGPIQVNALLIGDDYVRRANRLRAACKAAGPGTLVHPWLGIIKVRLSGDASFNFSHDRLRVCTVAMAFERWPDPSPSPVSTLGALLDQLDTLVDGAELMLAAALAPLGDAVGLLGLVQSVMSRVGAVWDGLLGGTSPLSPSLDVPLPPAAGIADAAASPLDQLTGGVALSPDDTLAAQVAGLLEAVPASIGATGDSSADPALGPGPLAAAPTPAADPRAVATLLLAALPRLLAQAGDLVPAVAVLRAARVQAVAEAARVASAIPWTSRDEALSWRDQVNAGFVTVIADLAVAAGAQPLVTGVAWRAARAAQAAWNADVNERVGRLPAVQYLVTLAPMSAWNIALAVAGDDPTAIRPTFLDIVARNNIRHPGVVPPGRIEVLAA